MRNLNEPMNTVQGTGKECLDLMASLNVEYFTTKSSILDIGCGDPGSFFYLFHSRKFLQYTGLDLHTRITVNIPMPQDQPLPEDLCFSSNTTLYERYELYNKYVIGNSEKLDEAAFQTTFRFMPGTDAKDFLTQEALRPKFDLIILSDFLHLYPNKSESFELLDLALNRLSENGFIWIKVFVQDYNSTTYPFDKNDLDLIRSRLSIIHEMDDWKKCLLIGKKKMAHCNG